MWSPSLQSFSHVSALKPAVSSITLSNTEFDRFITENIFKMSYLSYNIKSMYCQNTPRHILLF